MKPSAALLIDLENFYLSRLDHFRDENLRTEDRPSFAEDLRDLSRHAARLAGLPFAVRRAYADFDALRVDPQDLMRQGVEPVQVFRLSGKTGNKNAADMKLAMDAVALLGSAPIEHFVLVSGDADFIPVILELKRRGHQVSVIAVTGATNEFIQRFADKFELFENLVATPTRTRARAVPRPTTPDELPYVAAAVRRVLARSRPVRFNLVQPLLSKELGYAFDPAAFGCDSTGSFLRKNSDALGIVVRGTQNEQEIDLPAVPAPAANGSRSKAVASATPLLNPAADLEPHSPDQYRYLLASGRTDSNEARVLAVPWASLKWVCDAVPAALAAGSGGPTTSMELMTRLQTAARATSEPDLAAHVALIHSAVRSGLPVPSPQGVYTLAPEATGDQIRAGVLRYVVYVLGCRLAENGVNGPIRADSLAAVFTPGAEAGQATAEFAAAVARTVGAAPTPTTVAIPKPAPRAAEPAVHTPDAYRKLLQKTGPRGSGETEHMRVHVAPWPSVERACSDAFAALSPAGATLQRGQFLERLYAAENEMVVDNYRSHVRRAFALLNLSNAVLETDDRLALHPEVTEPSDIRWAVLATMLQLLAVRMSEKGLSDRIRPEVFAAAIEAGPLTDQLVPEIARALDSMYAAAAVAEAESAVATAPEATALEAVLAPSDEPDVSSAVPLHVDLPAVEPVPLADAVDPFAFDGTLPGLHADADCDTPQYGITVEKSASASAIDMAALTSAAVAAVVEPAVQVLPVATSIAPPPMEPIPELTVFAPRDPDPYPLLLPIPEPEPNPPEDDLPLAVAVGGWGNDEDSELPGADTATDRFTGSPVRLTALPAVDDDAFDAGLTFGVEQIDRLTGSSARLAPLPPPADVGPQVANITSPPQPPESV